MRELLFKIAAVAVGAAAMAICGIIDSEFEAALKKMGGHAEDVCDDYIF